MKVYWTPEGAEYIGTRSDRYPEAVDIAVERAEEARDDPGAVVTDPDPHSRTGGLRIVGYSPSAGFVISVVARRVVGGQLIGATAWKTSGAERRNYLEARDGRTL